jgi:hypothetical protein
MADAPKKTLGEKLQSINKPTLFLILILTTSIPLFLPGKVPNEPDPPTKALFANVMDIPDGSTVLIESDWTNSTRGESAGQFKALLRMLIRKHIKSCIYTAADPQAPKVARDTIRSLNEEQAAKGKPKYEEWTDWIHLGYFPSAEATDLAIGADIRKAFAGRKAIPPGGNQTDVFKSPVLDKITTVKDMPMMFLITASNTSNVVVERLTGAVPLSFLVTGVMGPETQVYYDSKQLVGLSKGLKGVYDLETMMENGATVNNKHYDGFKGEINLDQGALYYPTLHAALILLIVAVLIGNLGMALSRRSS